MKEIQTEIIIDSGPDRIWGIFSDTNNFPRWTEFIEKMEGSMKKGERMDIHLKTPKGNTMDIKPEVLINEPSKEFRWLGHFGGVNLLFNGEHYFKLEPVDRSRTRFVQGEKFTGILVPFLWKSLDGDTREGFNVFNRALKKRVESSQ